MKLISNKQLSGHFLAWCLAAILSLGVNTVGAGEVDGQGNPVPGGENGRSECSYSGQQDDAEADAGFFRGDRVQSWGQIPKIMRDILRGIGMHPGDACNPRKSGD
jgi:hypothetical protein